MSEPNYFGQLIGILHVEELLRLQKRCRMQKKVVLAAILNDEIEEREGMASDGKA
jgi:hypothetical protein